MQSFLDMTGQNEGLLFKSRITINLSKIVGSCRLGTGSGKGKFATKKKGSIARIEERLQDYTLKIALWI